MPIGQFREEWRIRRGLSQLSVGGGVARQSYLQKIIAMFGTSLIGYWPMGDEAGTVAVDYSGNGYNGVYTGVTLGQGGIGDGLTCPLYDGANDYMQPPAGFRTAFNGPEGTVGGWARVSASGVWSDGQSRCLASIEADANNWVRIEKTGTLNTMSFLYVAGGTSEFQTSSALAGTLNFFHWALTWSKSGEVIFGYLNGAQVITSITLGIWVGVPAATLTVFGSRTSTPAVIWDGTKAHDFVLNRAATPAEVAAASAI